MLKFCCRAMFLLACCAWACGQEPRQHGERSGTASETAGDNVASVASGPDVCPNGGSCCVEGGVGCNDVVCCTAVCEFDPWCCDTAWDFKCVAHANNLCDDLCAITKLCPGVGDCCTAHPEGGCSNELCCNRVCTAIPSCCEDAWGPECALEASTACSQCDTRPPCPREGDCCFNNAPNRGCEREACCELICSPKHDPYCCEVEWDDQCGAKARQFCPNVCVCGLFGDFDESGTIDLLDFAALQVCFTAGTGGYVGPGCECADYDGDNDSDLFDFLYFGL